MASENDFTVEYLIVGGYAVMRYSEPRFTKDLDIWVGNSAENSRRVFAALARLASRPSETRVTDVMGPAQSRTLL